MLPTGPVKLPAVLLALLAASAVSAQVAPSAGSVLRQLEPDPGAALPAVTAPEKQQERPAAPAGPRVHVTAFRFEGNSLIPSERLTALVAGFTNRDLAPDDLRQAADAVARAYSKAGWLARVFVPPQTVENGVLKLQVVEGRFGAVEFSADTDVNSLRVKPDQIVARAEEGLQPGAPVRLSGLERGVLLAGDLAGVTVTGSEAPGAAQGETDVLLKAQNEPLLTGDVSLDNFGQAAVGSERAVGHADLNSPLGLGEQFDGTGLVTPHMQYARGALALPLSADGLKLDLNASALHYAVDTPDYEVLDPRGSSTTFGGALEYQWLRAMDHNLAVGIDFERKSFDNTLRALKVSDYRIYDATLYVSGNVYDHLLGGAVSTGTLSFGHGWVQMSGSPDEYWDLIGPDTEGQFNVLRWRIDRTQRLPHDFSVYAALSGQLSYQNLDPAEKFYLGGPEGAGAAAVASDGGSSGQLATVELRWAGPQLFNCDYELKALYNAGHVRLYANDEWPAAPQPNSYFLQGVGAGATADVPFGLHLALTAVHRVGGDAGARAPDYGLTGARRDTRVWASLTKRF